ncbi:relaxase/mobilization nuclease domain-containing protein [Scatolibacter rhodanostii]|uniref:relaxase/mobilization nuclease domain-containing protein n=1 Tax=Scatolibacter rhodanostii TaxID=2014781 RepID=UPI000C07A034|nr:relaxase/mobilization nuclease domain-containing protein [Scatolibacter rhodanostii]
MATTKIKQIKRTTGKSLAYIMNPEKTDGSLLVWGFNVDPEVASMEFDFTYALAKNVRGDYSKVGGSDIKAYHMMQSFSPEDNLTPEQAHAIGKQWADEFLEGKHEYVIATHIDKDHIHNHIIFNATSYYNLKKFESVPYKTVKKLRDISDRLCEENNLSVLYGKRERVKENKKWKKEPTLGESLSTLLDSAVAQAKSFEDFKSTVISMGVEIKEGKHIAFKHPDGKRFMRGMNLPGDYSKEKILERVEHPERFIQNEKVPTLDSQEGTSVKVPETYADLIQKKSRRTLLEKTAELAETLLTIRREKIERYDDFDIRKEKLSETLQHSQKQVEQMNRKNQEYTQAAKYLLAYHDTLPIWQEYESCSLLKKSFYHKEHKEQLDKYKFALEQLKKMKVNATVDPDKVINLVKYQNDSVEEINQRMQNVQERVEKVQLAQNIVDRIENEYAAIQGRTQRKGLSK